MSENPRISDLRLWLRSRQPPAPQPVEAQLAVGGPRRLCPSTAPAHGASDLAEALFEPPCPEAIRVILQRNRAWESQEAAKIPVSPEPASKMSDARLPSP